MNIRGNGNSGWQRNWALRTATAKEQETTAAKMERLMQPSPQSWTRIAGRGGERTGREMMIKTAAAGQPSEAWTCQHKRLRRRRELEGRKNEASRQKQKHHEMLR